MLLYVIPYVFFVFKSLFRNWLARPDAYPNDGGSSLPMDDCFDQNNNYSKRHESIFLKLLKTKC